MTAAFINAFYEAFMHAGWKGIQSCIRKPRIYKGWLIRNGSVPGRPVKEV